MRFMERLVAEFVGTFWLVLGGCGSAILAGHFIGQNGVSLAFGLSVLTMGYAIGHVSGCHLNPAVSVGLAVAGRFNWRELPSYVGAQVLGAIAASAAIYGIAQGVPGADPVAHGFATNGYGERSPGGYSLGACLLTEGIFTFVFVLVILGSTDPRAPKGFAPLAIGLCLTLIHLVTIPVTNTSVNPARSTGPAAIVGEAAAGQLWAFWVAPVAGALLAGFLYPRVHPVRSA